MFIKAYAPPDGTPSESHCEESLIAWFPGTQLLTTATTANIVPAFSMPVLPPTVLPSASRAKDTSSPDHLVIKACRQTNSWETSFYEKAYS